MVSNLGAIDVADWPTVVKIEPGSAKPLIQ